MNPIPPNMGAAPGFPPIQISEQQLEQLVHGLLGFLDQRLQQSRRPILGAALSAAESFVAGAGTQVLYAYLQAQGIVGGSPGPLTDYYRMQMMGLDKPAFPGAETTGYKSTRRPSFRASPSLGEVIEKMGAGQQMCGDDSVSARLRQRMLSELRQLTEMAARIGVTQKAMHEAVDSRFQKFMAPEGEKGCDPSCETQPQQEDLQKSM